MICSSASSHVSQLPKDSFSSWIDNSSWDSKREGLPAKVHYGIGSHNSQKLPTKVSPAIVMLLIRCSGIEFDLQFKRNCDKFQANSQSVQLS